ncbi:hypothetical protein HDV02_000444 [Globomyces sp. JEL0801]|nr:hypothetical protein HDV02_000444 [Globomyces sp. JEL0801]
MTEKTKPEIIAISLIREYLAAHGLQKTLKEFTMEIPEDNTITSRRELSSVLGISKQVLKNRVKETPLKAFLEILTEHIISKVSTAKQSRSSKVAEDIESPSTITEKQSGNLMIKQPLEITRKLTTNDIIDSSLFKQKTALKKNEINNEPRPVNFKPLVMEDIEIFDDLTIDDHLDMNPIPNYHIKNTAQIKLQQFNNEDIKELSDILFSKTNTSSFPPEWKGKGFNFNTNPNLRYGLVQSKGGPCGLLASVQAHVIKHLCWVDNQNRLRPSLIKSRDALLQSLGEIIWKVGNGTAKLVLEDTSNSLLNEKSIAYGFAFQTFYSKESLIEALKTNKTQFLHRDQEGNGIIQFLYSVILSRTIPKIKEDMDSPDECLMGKHSYCTQEMVNLILIGKATSNLHDNVIDMGGQFFKGLNESCDIGQLSLFEYYKNLKVGKFGKEPKYPIFVVCSESHYSVFFGTMLQFSSEFDLFYYDGLINQMDEIRLTVSTQSAIDANINDLTPPLELCLRTKWPNLHLNWNDTEPIL